MVFVKKSSGGGAPTLDILAAHLRVEEAELTLEEKEVTPDNGQPFMAEPNLNCKLVVVKNLVEPGVHEGATFFDRFKLKKDKSGEWTFARYSKLGNLIIVRYGTDWFDDPNAEFEETDFEDFEFIAKVEPKTDPKGNELTGSVLNWKGMRRIGSSVEKVEETPAASGADVDDLEDELAEVF